MTSRHQHENEFDFTPTEMGHLLTTQRLAEAKDNAWNFDHDKPNDWYQATLGDMMQFGWDLQDAIDAGKTSILIKMSVVYRLTAIWNSMMTLGNKLTIPKDAEPFNRIDISAMHDRMWSYYQAKGQGK